MKLCPVAQAAERQGERIFIIDKHRNEITFYDFDRHVTAVAEKLAASKLAVKSNIGDCVLVFIDNCPNFIALLFALFRLGYIAVPIDRNQPPTHINSLEKQVRAAAILDPQQPNLISSIAQKKQYPQR